ncbi:MAG TPA: sigma-70 family RNA polymerase sigma factor [Acidimicrobiales bacterium]|nr:sigma-70 family RNA polymerase sigma factor [Acidimicrobiales bacterium]
MNTPSFDDLFRDQYPSVLRETMFVLGDRDLAKEVTNEAFARLYARWARISRYDKPGAWVRRVAIRLAVRGSGHQARQTTAVEQGHEGDPGLTLDVRDAVRRLAPQQRAAVMLHYFDDLPLGEVGRILGCREGTVKAHLHQARSRLGDLLVAYDANCR